MFFYKNQNKPSCPARICRKTGTQYFNRIAASDLLDDLRHFGQSAVIYGKLLEMDGFLRNTYFQNVDNCFAWCRSCPEDLVVGVFSV